jgi:HNH endonuclease
MLIQFKPGMTADGRQTVTDRDVIDQERFEKVARELTDQLQPYGLRPVSPFNTQDSECAGWWAIVADWARNRPKVSVWLDRTLGRTERHFWFGFQSTRRETLSALVRVVEPRFPNPARINEQDYEDNYSRLRQQASDSVAKSKGLTYETYEADFDHYDYFGKADIGFDFHSDRALVFQAASFISEIVQFLDPSLTEKRDIEEISSEADPTVREALILARRGQGQFRSDLFSIWGGCAVTGCTMAEVLRASHIKPWRKCEDRRERLDKNNGLLLSATLDVLFDRGVISFTNDGVIMISSMLTPQNQNLLALDSGMHLANSEQLNPQQKEYLKYHREHVYIADDD